VRAVRTVSVVTGPEPGGGDCVPNVMPAVRAGSRERSPVAVHTVVHSLCT